jgi:hypothetical protein
MRKSRPTWSDELKTQGPDLLLFAGFMTLAMVGFFRKSEILKWITMGASVVYLGFMRSQLITVVNIFALTQWNLPTFRQNLLWYAFAILRGDNDSLRPLYCGASARSAL